MRTWLGLILLFTGSMLQASEPGNPMSLRIREADTAKAMEYVKQLGSPSYKVREQAYRELSKMGRLAIRALEAGTQFPETEIRLRCSEMLPEAEAAELQSRIQAFLADKKNEYQHDLSGWTRFRTTLGDTAEVRNLFAAMLKNPKNYRLLLALKEVPEQQLTPLAGLAGAVALTQTALPSWNLLLPALNERRATLFAQHMEQLPTGGYRQTPPSVPDFGLLLFAESMISDRQLPWNQLQYQLISWMYQPALRDSLVGKGEYGDCYRRLFSTWMETRDSVNSITQVISLAQNLQLGTPILGQLAVRLLNVPAIQPWNKANALTMIARHNAIDQFHHIKDSLKDDTIVIAAQPINAQPEIQVRDVALAMALIMRNQDPKEYGMDLQHAQTHMRYNSSNFRFRDDSDMKATDRRSKAIEQFNRWEATQFGSIIGTGLATTFLQNK
jgi:hypothetical protein